MSKIRIYIESKDINDLIEVKDKNLVHRMINVLRLKNEDVMYVFDGQGKEYLCRIEAIAKKSVLIKREKPSVISTTRGRKIILGFPLVKEDKISFILQKATELGVDHFVPFTSQRSMRINVSEKKTEKWKRIILEALRQSERVWMPSVSKVLDFQEIIKSNYKVKLAASVDGQKINAALNDEEGEVLVIVGPEGGFSSSEHSELEKNNFKFFKLSSHILRVETASLFSVGLINYF